MYFGSEGLSYLQIPLWSASSAFDISPGYPRTDESFSRTIYTMLAAGEILGIHRKYAYYLSLFEHGRWTSFIK